MALPTPVRIYQTTHDTIATLADTAATAKRLIRTLKNRLIGFGAAPLTAVSSSNAVTAGAGDNWATDADIVGQVGANPHSWFVFGIPQIHANYQLLLDFNVSGAFNQSIRMYVSPTAGFTGGTISARPTATDEIQINTTQSFTLAANTQLQMYVYRATNGRGLRVLVFSAGLLIQMWIIDRPETPNTLWANPSIAYAQLDVTGSVPTTLFNGAQPQFRGRGNTGVSMPMSFMTWGGSNSSSMLTQEVPGLDSYSGEYLLPRIRLLSKVAGNLGDMGVVDDIWLCTTNIPSGDTFPNDTSRTHIVASPLVMPHDGSVVLTS
jgi:hypothetical protein